MNSFLLKYYGKIFSITFSIVSLNMFFIKIAGHEISYFISCLTQRYCFEFFSEFWRILNFYIIFVLEYNFCIKSTRREYFNSKKAFLVPILSKTMMTFVGQTTLRFGIGDLEFVEMGHVYCEKGLKWCKSRLWSRVCRWGQWTSSRDQWPRIHKEWRYCACALLLVSKRLEIM